MSGRNTHDGPPSHNTFLTRHHHPDHVALSLYGQLTERGAALTSVEMCLYELMGDCRHPAFREILALVK